jgi:hypothetical protein
MMGALPAQLCHHKHCTNILFASFAAKSITAQCTHIYAGHYAQLRCYYSFVPVYRH